MDVLLKNIIMKFAVKWENVLGLDSLNLVIVNISNFFWRQTGLNQYNRQSLWEVDIHYCVMELYNICYCWKPRGKYGTKEGRHIGSPRLIHFMKFCIRNWEWRTSGIVTYWYRDSKSIQISPTREWFLRKFK